MTSTNPRDEKSDLVLTLEYNKPKRLIKILLWIVEISLAIVIGLLIFAQVKMKQFIKEFATGANLSTKELATAGSTFLRQMQVSYDEQLATLPRKYTFLVLGTDKLSGRDGDPELTDTMMLLQVNFDSSQIKTLSLPRDLYSDDYKSKINAIYFYGKTKYPSNPAQFPKEVIEQLTSTKIDYTIVIGIEDLEKLIDLVGGIEIDVPLAFSDPLFPVQNIDVSKVSDPKLLYETVNFTAGAQHMDSATALKYMRSRHSQDGQGTDDARAARQQLVLQALFSKLLALRDLDTLGKLYRFYLDRYASSLPLSEIAKISAVGLDYLEKHEQPKFTFEKHQLGIYPSDPAGVIYNPPLWQSKQQWLYKIKDQAKFKETINAIFN